MGRVRVRARARARARATGLGLGLGLEGGSAPSRRLLGSQLEEGVELGEPIRRLGLGLGLEIRARLGEVELGLG